ncbi:hypothetical protein BV898_00421 [Hypsibius exemplaris]|uniref:Phorbol-ester/DAG-type domain-containing protein n=1 Tax=Hypsibius exemplaris TaxID=2072580 RepID=A0A1W0XDF9_HYPEX|nr:hypothetical protein BV898_00421 [Hypsibius exemplaris]
MDLTSAHAYAALAEAVYYLEDTSHPVKVSVDENIAPGKVQNDERDGITTPADPKRPQIKDREFPANWEVSKIWKPHGGWGNQYGVFVNEAKQEIVLAIRGTANAFNGLTDLSLIVAAVVADVQLPPGYSEALWLARSIFPGHEADNRRKRAAQIDEVFGGARLPTWVGRKLREFAEVEEGGTVKPRSIHDVEEVVAYRLEEKQLRKNKIEYRLRSEHAMQQDTNTALQASFDSFIGYVPAGRHRESQRPRRLRSPILTLVGHSMGAVIAELIAAELKVECVTFESPGSLSIQLGLPRFHAGLKWITAEPYHMVHYVGAPNAINKLDMKPGIRCRLMLPHLVGRELFVFLCLLNSGILLATYCSFGSTVVANCFGVTQLSNYAGWLFGGAVAAKGFGCMLELLHWCRWTIQQHRMGTIVDFFEKPVISQMKAVTSWPRHDFKHGTSRSGVLGRILAWPLWPPFMTVLGSILCAFVWPFKRGALGIRYLFRENEMRESQVLSQSDYIVQPWPDSRDERLRPYNQQLLELNPELQQGMRFWRDRSRVGPEGQNLAWENDNDRLNRYLTELAQFCREQRQPQSAIDGVQCGACGSDMRNVGYKCVKCKDYYLCIQCEKQGEHPGHCLLPCGPPTTSDVVQDQCGKCGAHFEQAEKKSSLTCSKCQNAFHLTCSELLGGYCYCDWCAHAAGELPDYSKNGEDCASSSCHSAGCLAASSRRPSTFSFLEKSQNTFVTDYSETIKTYWSHWICDVCQECPRCHEMVGIDYLAMRGRRMPKSQTCNILSLLEAKRCAEDGRRGSAAEVTADMGKVKAGALGYKAMLAYEEQLQKTGDLHSADVMNTFLHYFLWKKNDLKDDSGREETRQLALQQARYIIMLRQSGKLPKEQVSPWY